MTSKIPRSKVNNLQQHVCLMLPLHPSPIKISLSRLRSYKEAAAIAFPYALKAPFRASDI